MPGIFGHRESKGISKIKEREITKNKTVSAL
jgi:hypothetical protein